MPAAAVGAVGVPVAAVGTPVGAPAAVAARAALGPGLAATR
jgi:hypothetical protein